MGADSRQRVTPASDRVTQREHRSGQTGCEGMTFQDGNISLYIRKSFYINNLEEVP
jgi:hypothetical protein